MFCKIIRNRSITYHLLQETADRHQQAIDNEKSERATEALQSTATGLRKRAREAGGSGFEELHSQTGSPRVDREWKSRPEPYKTCQSIEFQKHRSTRLGAYGSNKQQEVIRLTIKRCSSSIVHHIPPSITHHWNLVVLPRSCEVKFPRFL
jgi:hypothetical protein